MFTTSHMNLVIHPVCFDIKCGSRFCILSIQLRSIHPEPHPYLQFQMFLVTLPATTKGIQINPILPSCRYLRNLRITNALYLEHHTSTNYLNVNYFVFVGGMAEIVKNVFNSFTCRNFFHLGSDITWMNIMFFHLAIQLKEILSLPQFPLPSSQKIKWFVHYRSTKTIYSLLL